MQPNTLEKILLEMGARRVTLDTGRTRSWLIRTEPMTYLCRTSRLHSFLALSVTAPVFPENVPYIGERAWRRMGEAIDSLESEFGYYRLSREDGFPFVTFTTCLWIDKKPTRKGFDEYMAVGAGCVGSAILLLRQIVMKGGNA